MPVYTGVVHAGADAVARRDAAVDAAGAVAAAAVVNRRGKVVGAASLPSWHS